MMIMTTWQGVVTIIMAILGTILTRFLPFLVFPESKEPPRFITYLGTVLPYAMTGIRSRACICCPAATAFPNCLRLW